MNDTIFEAGSTAVWSGTLKDEDDVAIPNTSINSMTLSLYYRDTSGTVTVINSRNAQDILGGSKTGANNVTVSAGGVVEWSLQVADTTSVSAVDSDLQRFTYTARIVCNYNSSRRLVHEFSVPISRLVPIE